MAPKVMLVSSMQQNMHRMDGNSTQPINTRDIVATRHAIASNLAARRRYLGIHQREVGNALGLDRRTIGYWERGDRPIPSEYVPHLARILRIREGDVFKRDPSNE